MGGIVVVVPCDLGFVVVEVVVLGRSSGGTVTRGTFEVEVVVDPAPGEVVEVVDEVAPDVPEVPRLLGAVATKVPCTDDSTPSRTLNTAARCARWSTATRPQSAPSWRSSKALVHRPTNSPSPPRAIDAPTTVSPTDRCGSTSAGLKPRAVRSGGTTDVRNAASEDGIRNCAVSARDRRSSWVPRSMASPR